MTARRTAEPVDQSTGRLAHLLNQVRWVTRMSVALSAPGNRDDIFLVLLAGLVSPMALGFTRALAFEVTSEGDAVLGKSALVIGSRRELDEMTAELRAETEFLENRKRDLMARAAEDTGAAEELRTLELGAQWITISQRVGTDGDEAHAVQAMRYPLEPADSHDVPEIFRRALAIKTPMAFGTNGGRPPLPAALQALLPGPFAVVPLHTNRGLRAVLVLDRHLTGDAITADDLDALDWFATQGAMALQNAELIRDLENAYGELKAVDQLKSNFLSIISHELRTPLTAITGFVELILNARVGPVNESQRNLLVRVAKNTGHLNNMVNDLIEIAEIEAEGITDVSLVAVDPLNTLFSTLPKLEYRRRDSKVDIHPVFEGEVPSILCDARALERIFFHLLDNAMKFSPENQPVEVAFSRPDESRLSISICDRGPGIPKDKLQRIFEQFYQVDNSLTRSHEGLGIGLAVTRMLVQATRGEIHVESVVGRGSKFTIVYPLAGPQPPGIDSQIATRRR